MLKRFYLGSILGVVTSLEELVSTKTCRLTDSPEVKSSVIVPHHATQNPEYTAMFRILDLNFKAISKDCFEKESNKLFQKMVTSVSALIKTSIDDYKGEISSLSIVHDMWTTMNNEAALGGSVKFTTKEMNTYTIAALLDKNNARRLPKGMALMLRQKYPMLPVILPECR